MKIEQLKQADQDYYNGNPSLTDAQYDTLKEQAYKETPNDPYFQAVGASVETSPWVKVSHHRPMGSLSKAQTYTEMSSWFQAPSVVMDKLDGASISLIYKDGKFTQAITRGDGLMGEDVTRNVSCMKGLVKIIPDRFTGCIRGEVLCLLEDFKAHFPGMKNPRNTASGTMKRLEDPEPCSHLTVYCYEVSPDLGLLETKENELQFLEQHGFLTPRWAKAQTPAEVELVYQEYIKFIRASLYYEIDGLVVEIDDRKLYLDLGFVSNRPKGAVAYKFPHEEQETFLRDIVWQTGPSGRVTPVAVFDSVSINGAQIDRASLATVKQVNQLQLYAGCKILVSRRNGVIPRIEANIDRGIINE